MPISKKDERSAPWMLLTFSLPRKGASFRVSVWRKLQRYGGPHGEAFALEVQSIDNYSGSQLARRFSDVRTQDYRELLKDLKKALPKELLTQFARLDQRFQEIVSVDCFGSRVMSAWLRRKFIDPKRRFVFSSEEQKPKDSVPFGMYEGGPGRFRRREGFDIDEVMKGWVQQDLSEAELLERGMQLAE